MPVPSVNSLVSVICGDKALRKAAVAAVKEEEKHVLGRSKLTRKEIDRGLESRLYLMTYLAKAITGIIKHPEVRTEVKKSLASSYLQLLGPFDDGKLPKRVLDSGFEPDYAIDLAVFLDQTGDLDWRNHELIALILRFGAGSTEEAKEKFLELFVEHVNNDGKILRHYTRQGRGGKKREIPLTPWNLSPLMEFMDADELTASPAALSLFKLLSPVISSKRTGKNVSLKALGRLECLTLLDVTWFMDHLLFYSIPNKVKACEDLYVSLMEKGADPVSLLGSLITSVKEDPVSKYSGESRVKGFLRAVSGLSLDKMPLLPLLEELLEAGARSEARLAVYRFIYEETGEKEVLERARSDGAKKIREWADKQPGEKPL